MRRGYLNVFDALFSRFSWCPFTISSHACLSLSCSRDSTLFITRFVNLNANWFCKGLSVWGPTPVLPHRLSACARVCVLCTCWIPEWHVLTVQASSCLSVCFECGTDTVRVHQARETSAALGEKKKTKKKGQKTGKKKPHRKTPRATPTGCLQGLCWWGGGGREAQQQTWIMAVRKVYGAGWWGVGGQLNDPRWVARRRRGWMVEINAGIHPRWRAAEGGWGGGV